MLIKSYSSLTVRYSFLLGIIFCLACALFFVGRYAEVTSRLPAQHSKTEAWAAFDFILRHNMRCFEMQWIGGFLLGVPTVLEVVLNGATCGALLQSYPGHVLVSLVLPHAIPENLAFFWNGGATLAYAHCSIRALLAGSLPSRQETVAFFSHVAGASMLLTVAAGIESYLTVQRIFG
jgi:uncharacterized membrane protein SpoIIM required for sporulation